ncbi:MAG TPA: NAD(P)H-dependent oxidoreductase, partial [Xanthobacteraceae bacterium]|nr:NAD(P)H-dependent oxidoreductase [Xanthobacteraceae bacterium]
MADPNNLNVLVICGSLRKGSYNAMVARSLPALAPAGMKLAPSPTIVMPLYNADVQNEQGWPAPVNALADAIRAADGVIFVSPEYNYSMPGVLKNAIDWVSRLPNQPFAFKPIALQSASQGPLGGPRMQYHFRQSMIFLDAFVFNRPEIFIGNVKSKVDEAKGELTDQPTLDIVKQQLAGFAKFIVRVSG